MTPLMIRVIDALLGADARKTCSDPAAATKRHHRLRGRYLGNRKFRRAVNKTARRVHTRLQQRRNDTVTDILRRQAELIAPGGADLLREQLLHDYAGDPDYRCYIDGLCDIIQTGALQMVTRGEVPRPEGEPIQ